MRGCILKSVEGCEFVRIIETIDQGSLYVSPELGARRLRQRMHANGVKQRESRPYNLTARETQILDCVGRALTNKEIGRELQISAKTVKHYMTNIMEKLQVRNRIEAVLKFKFTN
jgi:two-component system, NarL family, nitrate/nitrite response regulator NarL